MIYHDTGTAWLQNGEVKQAETFYRKGLHIFEQLNKHDPKNIGQMQIFSSFLEQLGSCCEQSGKPELSKEYFKKCLILCEKQAVTGEMSLTYQLIVAKAYANCNRYEEGLKIINKLTNILPLTAQILTARILIYSKMNNIDNALYDLHTMQDNELFNLSIQNDPGFKNIHSKPEFVKIIQAMQKKCDMF